MQAIGNLHKNFSILGISEKLNHEVAKMREQHEERDLFLLKFFGLAGCRRGETCSYRWNFPIRHCSWP